MAEFIKAQSRQQLWKAALKPTDPLKPDDPLNPSNPLDQAGTPAPLRAATAPGTGVLLDMNA
jgi:hypothetical protein